MKGETWEVDQLIIDGEEQFIKGRWRIIQDINIYDNVPSAFWIANDQEKVFRWQFRDKGKIFEIIPDSICIGSIEDLDFLAYAISGKYQVDQQSKQKMTFTSSNTASYSGKEVEIYLERVK